MLHLCFAARLRVSEIVGVRIQDMTLQPHTSVLICGKGLKERSSPFGRKPPRRYAHGLRCGEVRSPRRYSLMRAAEPWLASASSSVCASMSRRLRSVVARSRRSPALPMSFDTAACLRFCSRPKTCGRSPCGWGMRIFKPPRSTRARIRQ